MAAASSSIRDFTVTKNDGSESTIADIAGDKPILIVNVASK